MANENNPIPSSGDKPVANGQDAEPRRSLRDIAEAAYEDLSADEGVSDQQPETEDDPGRNTRPRDTQGRFRSRESGEAADDEQSTQPRDDEIDQAQATPHPAAQEARSSEAPANWSQGDREAFAKLPQEGQQFLLRRHSEMEGDYQRRVQATARAAEFAEALAPVFRDPVVSGSLQQARISPYDAIVQWAGFHRRAMSPNVMERVGLLNELAKRMQIDPAVVAQNRPATGAPANGQLSAQDLQDPAIRFFADTIGKTSSEVMQLRAALQGMQQQGAARQQAEQVRQARWNIDQVADEVGKDGQRLRPDFDTVLPQIVELMRINPQRDIREAYETARWMTPEVRQNLVARERQAVEHRHSDQRAAQQVRSNVRGRTSPVAKPDASQQRKGLRASIEASADEIGY